MEGERACPRLCALRFEAQGFIEGRENLYLVCGGGGLCPWPFHSLTWNYQCTAVTLQFFCKGTHTNARSGLLTLVNDQPPGGVTGQMTQTQVTAVTRSQLSLQTHKPSIEGAVKVIITDCLLESQIK